MPSASRFLLVLLHWESNPERATDVKKANCLAFLVWRRGRKRYALQRNTPLPTKPEGWFIGVEPDRRKKSQSLGFFSLAPREKAVCAHAEYSASDQAGGWFMGVEPRKGDRRKKSQSLGFFSLSPREKAPCAPAERSKSILAPREKAVCAPAEYSASDQAGGWFIGVEPDRRKKSQLLGFFSLSPREKAVCAPAER
jgi:hypothetical protein